MKLGLDVAHAEHTQGDPITNVAVESPYYYISALCHPDLMANEATVRSLVRLVTQKLEDVHDALHINDFSYI